MRLRESAAAALLAGAVTAAAAGEPPAEPMLRIEAGMHTAPIWSIATDDAGRYVVTGSHDKTVRVWEAAGGRLLQVLRPPIGPGSEGRIDAVAISPDGATIACGGWTGQEWDGSFCIYLFRRATGEMVGRIPGLPDVIRHLAFGPGGRSLAAALAGRNGIRVFSIPAGTPAGGDKEYRGDSYGLAFDRAGRLATTCDDGLVRLYDARLGLLERRRAPGGKHPHGIAFCSDGTRLAVGYDDAARVDVLSGAHLSPLHYARPAGAGGGALSSVAWSADGATLYTGGTCTAGGQTAIVCWDARGRGQAREIPAAGNTLLGLAPLSGGGVAFGAADPAFGVLSAAGERALFVGPPTADYRGGAQHFLLSADGAALRFSFQAEGRAPARFSLAERALSRVDLGEPRPAAPGEGPVFGGPRTVDPAVRVTGWQNGGRPQLNGKSLPLAGDERPLCLAIAPGGDHFLLGTEWFLRAFDRHGKDAWSLPSPGATWAVNVAGDGRVAAAAFGDGTIQWFAMAPDAEGRPLLTLFPHADRARWVAWTPTGYYVASVGGEDLVGWHVNRGKDREALFFPASHYRDTRCRPDVVEKILQTLDEPTAVLTANGAKMPAQAGGAAQAAAAAAQRPPTEFRPVVRIHSPEDGAEVGEGLVKVRFAVMAPPEAPATSVRVLVDGVPLGTREVRVAAAGAEAREVDVPIPPRDCAISLLAANRYGPGEPATRRLRWTGAGPTSGSAKLPRLHVLAIGISAYRDADLQLSFAARDARDFAAALKRQEGRLYSSVTTETLLDAEATRERVVDALVGLRDRSRQEDVVVLFFSGHGHNDAEFGDYYFLPADVNPNRVPTTAVASSDIRKWVERVPGRVIVFVDTCHAANARGRPDATQLLNALRENGAVVFAASTGKQVAFEDKAWGNGAFTKALVEGLDGKADLLKRGVVTVNTLDMYLLQRVGELTYGRQTPGMGKSETIPDFALAVCR